MEYYKIELLIEITFLSKKRLYFCTVKASDGWSIYDKSFCQTYTGGGEGCYGEGINAIIKAQIARNFGAG